MLVKILCFQGHSTTSTSCRATLKPEQSFRSHRWSPITAQYKVCILNLWRTQSLQQFQRTCNSTDEEKGPNV